MPPLADPPVKQRPDWRNGIAMAVVILLLAAAIVLLLVSRFRRAATVLAVTMYGVGSLRLFAPPARLGPLAVRSRTFDVGFCYAVGAFLTWMVLIE